MATSRSSRGSFWIVAVMLALVIGAIAGSHYLFDVYGSADDLDAALVYPAGDSAQVVILDRVSHDNRFDTSHTARLNLWAPGEDSPRIRKRVPGARMLAPGAQLFWMYSPEHGVHARDPATLEVRMDEEGLRRRNPALAAGLMAPDSFDASKVHSGLDEATGQLVVTTKEGRRFVIHPESFEATPFVGERVTNFLSFSGACAVTGPAAGQTGGELRGEGPRQEVRIAGRSVGEFVTPQTLASCRVEASPESSVALLLHRGVLEEKAPSRLTALSPEGGALWTAELTGESGWSWVRVLFAAVSGGEVILVVQGERGALSGLDYGLVTLDRLDGRIKSSTPL